MPMRGGAREVRAAAAVFGTCHARGRAPRSIDSTRGPAAAGRPARDDRTDSLMAKFNPLNVMLATAFVMLAAAPAVAQDAGLRIVVIEGEDSVNIIEQGTAVPTLVEVRDRNDLPVSGASVLFLLGEGGTATLNAGLSQVALTTNALGQAAVTVNPIAAGAVELSVSAAFGGETATAAIVQANFATAAEAAAAGAGAAGGHFLPFFCQQKAKQNVLDLRVIRLVQSHPQAVPLSSFNYLQYA